MYKKLLSRKYAMFLFLTLISGITHLQAQTTLATGDISIIGFNSALTNRDGFAFVPWVDLAANTVIKFTDNGFNNTASALNTGNFRDQEQTATWTASSPVTAGTVITIEGNGSSATMLANTGTVTVTNSSGTVATSLNLSPGGDQIFAFQGGSYFTANSTSGTMAAFTVMLYGISFQGIVGASTWLSSGSAGTANSYLPTELASNSLFLGSSAYAGEYTGARTGLTIAQYKAAINNAANWTISGGVTTYNTTAMSIGSASISGHPSNSSICSGSNTSFTVTASNVVAYQWQVNTGSGFGNVSNGGVYSGASTATLSITGGTTGMSGYAYQCVVSGGSVTSNSATLTVSSPGTWLGASNSNWSNTANWSCGTLPIASTDVTIPSGTTFSPQIDLTTAICNNLTINSGATLAFVAGSNVLEVKGSITNNGTFTASSGTLKLSGTSQSIPGLAYKDLTISGGSSKTLAAAATISGTLTLTNGYLQLGANNLTLGNSATISGAGTSSYIVTNSTGALRIQDIGAGGRTGAVTFPVGTSTSSYTPVNITNIGTTDVFGVRVIPAVYKSYDASEIPNGAVQNMYNVDKTWIVTEGIAGGSSTTLNFTWYPADEQPGFTNSVCFGAHFYNGNWHPTASGAANYNGTSYDVSLTNVTSFSPFAIGSQSSILPLNLLSFTGKTNEGKTALTWVTTNEKEVAGFDVERSLNGSSYQRVGNVPARAGSSTLETTYNYTDNDQATGTVYYRLKMVDKDGSFTYSSVVRISASENRAAVYSLYPNSVKGNVLTLVTPLSGQPDAYVRIVDASGTVWHKEMIPAAVMNTGKVAITATSLPMGIYYLQVHNPKTGAVQLLTFRKEAF
jgi:hypothetical protein